jgi:hypothetical protein
MLYDKIWVVKINLNSIPVVWEASFILFFKRNIYDNDHDFKVLHHNAVV